MSHQARLAMYWYLNVFDYLSLSHLSLFESFEKQIKSNQLNSIQIQLIQFNSIIL